VFLAFLVSVCFWHFGEGGTFCLFRRRKKITKKSAGTRHKRTTGTTTPLLHPFLIPLRARACVCVCVCVSVVLIKLFLFFLLSFLPLLPTRRLTGRTKTSPKEEKEKKKKSRREREQREEEEEEDGGHHADFGQHPKSGSKRSISSRAAVGASQRGELFLVSLLFSERTLRRIETERSPTTRRLDLKKQHRLEVVPNEEEFTAKMAHSGRSKLTDGDQIHDFPRVELAGSGDSTHSGASGGEICGS
jgi:hypothetical protein